MALFHAITSHAILLFGFIVWSWLPCEQSPSIIGRSKETNCHKPANLEERPWVAQSVRRERDTRRIPATHWSREREEQSGYWRHEPIVLTTWAVRVSCDALVCLTRWKMRCARKMQRNRFHRPFRLFRTRKIRLLFCCFSIAKMLNLGSNVNFMAICQLLTDLPVAPLAEYRWSWTSD